jgi:hypothetical protein
MKKKSQITICSPKKQSASIDAATKVAPLVRQEKQAITDPIVLLEISRSRSQGVNSKDRSLAQKRKWQHETKGTKENN